MTNTKDVHKMMLPQKLYPEDKILLREVLMDEEFMREIVVELGEPVEVKISEEQNLVRFTSPQKTKTMWIDVLLAYTKGEVH
jgi:hypothetical protein